MSAYRYQLLQQKIWEEVTRPLGQRYSPMDIIPILKWIDDHPEEAPKTIQKLSFLKEFEADYEGAELRHIQEKLERLGITFEEESTSEKINRLFRQWDEDILDRRTFGAFLAQNGAKFDEG